MRAAFDSTVQTEAVLQSPLITLNSSRCLKISYRTLSSNYYMTVVSDPHLIDYNTTFPLLYGVKHLFIRLPVGKFSLSFKVIKDIDSSIDDDLSIIEEVRIYQTKLLPGACPAVGE